MRKARSSEPDSTQRPRGAAIVLTDAQRACGPHQEKRRQIAPAGMRGERRLAVVAVPVAAVLVGDVAPAPVGERSVGEDPELGGRVDALGGGRAQVCPVVTEVEHVHELLSCA